jgi:hypothetical protein
MLSDYKNSFSSLFHDRVTSPFWGTLILSWLVWNWQIIVLLFFVSEGRLPINKATGVLFTKIEYINTYYFNIKSLLWGPLASTLVLITIVPFAVNASYWLTLKFKKWRIDQKNEVENNQVLTIEQSLELRTEMKDQKKEFNEILEDKNTLIQNQEKIISGFDKTITEKDLLVEQYKTQFDDQQKVLMQKEINNSEYIESINKLNHTVNEKENLIKELKREKQENSLLMAQKDKYNSDLLEQMQKQTIELDIAKNELERLGPLEERIRQEGEVGYLLAKVLKHTELKSAFHSILTIIHKRKGSFAGSNIMAHHIAFYEGNSIIEPQKDGVYKFTDKGREFQKQFSEKVSPEYG